MENQKRRGAPIQDAILEFLRDYKQDPDNDGNSPSYREVADALGKNPADIHRRVLAMERTGLVRVNKRGKIVLVGGRYIAPD
jgi:predicted transcriptional regulator